MWVGLVVRDLPAVVVVGGGGHLHFVVTEAEDEGEARVVLQHFRM